MILAIQIKTLPQLAKSDAPTSSLMELTASPKAKIAEEGVGECSVARSTLGVKSCVGASGWGLGRFTSKSITHMDLHNPHNKSVSA